MFCILAEGVPRQVRKFCSTRCQDLPHRDHPICCRNERPPGSHVGDRESCIILNSFFLNKGVACSNYSFNPFFHIIWFTVPAFYSQNRLNKPLYNNCHSTRYIYRYIYIVHELAVFPHAGFTEQRWSLLSCDLWSGLNQHLLCCWKVC